MLDYLRTHPQQIIRSLASLEAFKHFPGMWHHSVLKVFICAALVLSQVRGTEGDKRGTLMLSGLLVNADANQSLQLLQYRWVTAPMTCHPPGVSGGSHETWSAYTLGRSPCFLGDI